ncbi:MAG: alpha/beta hydrolase [Pigmentiphaga sp.]|uniref:alpha/beta fold hydrolase n=1 Tax=Pigmentiphaga sp. TaxID=1977564 RepID=UPI0029AC77B5|nr:alpha/beta hydrolase [Pigmentiphaga sp.]MDX3906230.1 alpha/beta hydrolase [Pigmentiphaga sp.]
MPARSTSITSQGLSLHLVEWGADELPAVVLLHGLRAYGYWFEEFAEAAAGSFHLIALDQRGRGASDWAPAGRYTTDDYVADIAALVEQKNLHRYALVGHSMGGTNALNYAAAKPPGLEALVIVDSAPELDPRGLARIREELGRTPGSFASQEEALDFLRPLHRRASARSLATRLEWMLMQDAQGRWQWRIDPKIFDPRMTPDPPERSWKAVADVACPVLVVRGSDSDLVTRDCADRMAAEFRHASRAEIPAAAHMVVEDNPAAFTAAVLPFLENTLGAASR